jgi:capsid protein
LATGGIRIESKRSSNQYRETVKARATNAASAPSTKNPGISQALASEYLKGMEKARTLPPVIAGKAWQTTVAMTEERISGVRVVIA